MKLFLIKVGKIFKTIQREGVLRGGKRVVIAVFAMFRFVGKGDVLFITGGVGDSARYRAHHVAEELELNGFKCSITVQDNPFLAGYANKFKVFVFHRVLFTPSVATMIENIKKQNKEIIFETDDLVYDPKYLQFMDYFKQMNALERKLYENGVGGEILADPYVKSCSTTTTFLAEKLRENKKMVFIVPNKLSKKDVEVSKEILRVKAAESSYGNTVKLGYFSGTLSHNKDFATITKVLVRVMEKYENVELFLVGPLDLESELNRFSVRIKQLPYVQREKHFANLASVDVNLVPLESDNPFCEAKSELKFFEAAIVKVPTVAVANQTFKEAIEDGVDGCLAKDETEWFEKIERLVLDKNLRRTIGEKARAKTLVIYTTENADNKEYYAYLKSKINFKS